VIAGSLVTPDDAIHVIVNVKSSLMTPVCRIVNAASCCDFFSDCIPESSYGINKFYQTHRIEFLLS